MTGFSAPQGPRSNLWERHEHTALGAGMQTTQEFGYCKQVRASDVRHSVVTTGKKSAGLLVTRDNTTMDHYTHTYT
jgi:hypothetical protein